MHTYSLATVGYANSTRLRHSVYKTVHRTVLFNARPSRVRLRYKIKKLILEDELLAVDYTKDVLGSFAYEFELLHNRSFLVKSFAYAHGEIIYSVNCEI